jgi:hypothetical protein
MEIEDLRQKGKNSLHLWGDTEQNTLFLNSNIIKGILSEPHQRRA